ncbi:serum response factor-binding protein 1 isoform X1 [Ahaetulla prasina]|uniref:serum response factor-binding protein 1 isoform X1 n=2 Tax=Ahaetulla prasina TaxID=499056 RepID=UPI002649171C|nr:serum response factor-binding protein 1 isoform X1 [Ahaetulla prasina]
MAQVLNLNNEVVKMRKEVKKIRVLTIRKLTRQIAKLKGKKGTKEAVLKNQRRAQRLLEEIHAMKEIKLDEVTKSALGREIDFGIICKKPNSTARDRAIARLTSHPLLKTKIANIKAAVKDFKNARQKPARAISSTEQQLEEQLNKHPEETQHSISSETVKQAESQDKTKAIEKAQTDRGEKHIFESGIEKMADNMKKCSSYTSAVPDTENEKLIHQIGNSKYSQEKIYLNDTVNKTIGDSDEDVDKSEDSRKEECFDDSTEERFNNQSSGTDESNNNDDFFIGKVKRMKKKRAANASQPTEQKIKTMPLKKTKNPQRDRVLDPNSKDSIQSSITMNPGTLYYHVMSDTQPKILKRNIRGHYMRDRTIFEKNNPQKRMSQSSAVKHTIGRDPPQQPLHPSWEARRQMREQISQITAFQGKKIKFED